MSLLTSAHQLLSSSLGESRVKYNEPLSRHTYFKLGGPADLFFEAKTQEDLVLAVRSALEFQVPYFVLGGGSNILVRDGGYRGLVIKNKTSDIKLKGFSGSVSSGTTGSSKRLDLKEVIVEADSGVPANQLIRYTLDQGLAGLENMLGLPGTVGGAVYNNSHHLDSLFGDHIIEVKAMDSQGNIVKYPKEDLKFDYDHSRFHESHELVLSASFLLKRGDKTALWDTATAAVKRRSVTQPLGKPSSGCIFRNIKLADAMRIGTPAHTTSAGYLIDKAGLKGESVGGASVSEVHANFIVSSGVTTTQDVLTLVKIVTDKVKDKYGVTLALEIFVIGEN